MVRRTIKSPRRASASAMMASFLLLTTLPASVGAFAPSSAVLPAITTTSLATSTTTTSLAAMNKRNKFNKQKDLAAKMAAAKRLREQSESGVSAESNHEGAGDDDRKEELTAAEIKMRNDRKRFEDLLDNSMARGGDFDKGYYKTERQEDEEADAVFRGVVRLYEGDPAPTAPFAELLNIDNGEPYGKGGMKRLVPWEGSKSSTAGDYLVVVTDPRPKSPELRTAVKQLVGSLSKDVLQKCLVINADTPAENRRFVKRNLPTDDDGRGNSGLRVACDENLEWMREYTALGEKRFSTTVFVLRGGRVARIAREVEAEVLPMVVRNAIRSLD